MGFWAKVKQVAQPAAQLTGAVAPGAVGDIARLVEQAISNDRDPHNLGALRALANEVVTLQVRVAYLEQVLAQRR